MSGKSLISLQNIGGAHTDLTHLEFIYFWIASIIAHASPPSGRDMKGKHCPRIIIVGTHRDSLPGSEEDKAKKVKKNFTFVMVTTLLKFISYSEPNIRGKGPSATVVIDYSGYNLQ